jgi:hypothetical protein
MADELVSTAGVLTFDPATEFQVLEDLDYEELVQRPEEIRFFTLEQQTTDYIQKILPQTGRIPKGVLRDAEHEVETMRQLYARILRETDEGYEQVPPGRPTSLEWVTPYSDKPPKWDAYSFDRTWKPLFADAGQGIPYTAILDALPKWSMFSESGTPMNITDQTVIASTATDKVYPFLGPATYTKTAFREDGTYTIQRVPRPETQDRAHFVGYRVGIPPKEAPNPLDDNPFLSRRTAAVTIPSEEPLAALLPGVDLIMEHAVPSTTNPYKEALPFMKVWDIQMTEVPWSIWKSKFAPEETLAQSPPPVEIPIPSNGDTNAPSEDLQGLYGTKYTPGQAPRHWLSRQLDGGRVVPTLLLSKAGAQQPIPVPPPLPPMDESSFPTGTPDDCMPGTVSSFEALAGAGVYRPASKRCVPLTFIVQEQEELPYKGRSPWLPDTEQSIRDTYARLLKSYTLRPEKPPAPPTGPAGGPAIAQSETRAQILALLEDTDTRMPEDIAADIRTLLRITAPEPLLSKHIYQDGVTGGFLICEHTLAELDGEFNRNREAFLKMWSAKESGKVVCQFCGDTISNEVLVVQDQFDEEGRPIVSYGSLETVKERFSADHTTKAFAVSLKEMRPLFDLSQPGEDIMYLILSLLQVLPEPDKMKPFLDLVKTEGGKLKPLIAGKDAKKSADARLVASLLGFASTILLVQTHTPPLIPRRSVGTKPLQTKGFPRDSSDLNDAPFVDGLLTLMKRTFEDLPVTFTGSSVVFIRVLIQNQKSLRTKVLATTKKLADGPFKTALAVARDTLVPLEAVGEPSFNAFDPPLFRFEKASDIAPGDTLVTKTYDPVRCTDPLPAWYAGLQVNPPFLETPIVAPISPAPGHERLPIPEVRVLPAVVPPMDQVRERIRIGLPKDFASPTYRKITESDDAHVLQRGAELILDQLGFLLPDARLLARIRQDVVTAAGDASLLRDTFKGLLYELARATDTVIQVNLEKALATSLAVRGLLTSADASKSVRDKLRAQETAQYKQRLRVMSDNEREITKKLQDLKLGIYLVTKDDRETFMRELARQFEDVEEPDPNVVADGEPVAEGALPEEGLGAERDGGPQGNDEYDENGNELEDDYGDYGDRAARATEDGEDVPELAAFNYEEGYGV